MKTLFFALFLSACGSSGGHGAPDTMPDSGGDAGGSGPVVDPAASAGAAGDTGAAGEGGAAPVPVDPNTDKLFGPCGPLNCPDPEHGAPLDCYDGTCTFSCQPLADAIAAACADVGGACTAHGDGPVICHHL